MKKKLRAIVEDSHFFKLKSGSGEFRAELVINLFTDSYKLKKSEGQTFLIEI
jgi:hypothetical protein